jgi:hypothetical protein
MPSKKGYQSLKMGHAYDVFLSYDVLLYSCSCHFHQLNVWVYKSHCIQGWPCLELIFASWCGEGRLLLNKKDKSFAHLKMETFCHWYNANHADARYGTG